HTCILPVPPFRNALIPVLGPGFVRGRFPFSEGLAPETIVSGGLKAGWNLRVAIGWISLRLGQPIPNEIGPFVVGNSQLAKRLNNTRPRVVLTILGCSPHFAPAV